MTELDAELQRTRTRVEYLNAGEDVAAGVGLLDAEPAATEESAEDEPIA